jgi:hypothetical protein
MRKAVKALLRKIRGKAKRSVEADIYVISYPKSGRTWLRALIGRYLSSRYGIPDDDMLSTERVTRASGLPTVSFSHDTSALKNGMRYQDLSPDRAMYADKKVILLGRGIKDTLVSSYFQATKRIRVFEGSISEFIRSERFGIRKMLAFYGIWLRNRHVPESFLFIRYEDLHANPAGTMKKVLVFIGEVDIDEDLLEASIEYCSFESLRKLEERNAFKTGILNPVNDGDPDSFKVRKGSVGGYTEHLSEEDVEFIDELIADRGFDFSRLR